MKKTIKIKPILIFTIIFCICAGGILYAYIGNRPKPANVTQVENALAEQVVLCQDLVQVKMRFSSS